MAVGRRKYHPPFACGEGEAGGPFYAAPDSEMGKIKVVAGGNEGLSGT